LRVEVVEGSGLRVDGVGVKGCGRLGGWEGEDKGVGCRKWG